MGTTPLAAYPYPDLTDPPNGPGQFLAALAAAEKKDVLTFTTAAARTAAITAPVAGMLVYLTTTQQLTLYDGTAWIVIVAPWTSYTPTLGGTGWAVGNGTLTGRACMTADRVDFSIRLVLGSTSTAGAGNPTLTLPSATHAEWTERLMRASTACSLFDTSASATNHGRAGFTGGSTITPLVTNAAGTYVADANVTGTVPFTFAVGDEIAIAGWYRP